jgi:hypothetical protein
MKVDGMEIQRKALETKPSELLAVKFRLQNEKRDWRQKIGWKCAAMC